LAKQTACWCPGWGKRVGGFAKELHGPGTEPPQGFKTQFNLCNWSISCNRNHVECISRAPWALPEMPTPSCSGARLGPRSLHSCTVHSAARCSQASSMAMGWMHPAGLRRGRPSLSRSSGTCGRQRRSCRGGRRCKLGMLMGGGWRRGYAHTSSPWGRGQFRGEGV
jgi:hypothetical protein